MKNPFDDALRNPRCQNQMRTILRTEISKVFHGQRRIQLCAYLSETTQSAAKTLTYEQWQDTLEAACSACWCILQELPPTLQKTLKEHLLDYDEGRITDTDLGQSIAKSLARTLFSRVTDIQRDKIYASLRQAIDRAKENGQPVFQTKFESARGMFFSPTPVPDSIPEAAYPVPPSPPSLDSANPELGKGRIKSTLITAEARRYWSAFVEDYYHGSPGLVPLYGMYCWIRESIDLGASRILSLDDSGTTGEDDKPSLGETEAAEEPTPEASFLWAEEDALVQKRALDFVNGLSEQERTICALYQGNVTTEKIAKKMGLKGASSLTRPLHRLLTRLRQHATQFGDSELQILFVERVQEECTKIMSAPIEEE